MAVMVRVPTPLRRLTNGQDKLEVEATNISEMIDHLDTGFPGFK